MKINGETLQNLFRPGAELFGAAAMSAELFGENYADGSADGCEILFSTSNGGAALLTLDALDGETLTARYISTDSAADADEADRRRIAELEKQADEIRRQYPALQLAHEKAMHALFDD